MLILYQIMSAFSEILKKKIIHRDLKLENIMLCDNDRIKITDFGLAMNLEGEDEVSDKKVNEKAGTPLTMAPEVWLSTRGKPYDSRADIWSIGCVYYYLLYMRHPFSPSKEKFKKTEDIIQELRRMILKDDVTFPENTS